MGNKYDSLGDRMKGYENVPKTYLIRRMPVIIRLDGKAFHTFTKGFKRPFDEVLMKTMDDTMKYLCENIQGCVLGYKQSDEITLVLVDYRTLKTDPWFEYSVEKMCSVAASMATLAFNKAFENNVLEFVRSCNVDYENGRLGDSVIPEKKEDYLHTQSYMKALKRGATFDARVFNVPKEEVMNCLLWRQQDATRNSIQAVGQTNFSHKRLNKKSCNMIQEMLYIEKNINWNDFPVPCKRGTCCIKERYFVPCENGKEYKYPDNSFNPGFKNERGVWRSRWVIDDNIPIFNQEPNYIHSLILV